MVCGKILAVVYPDRTEFWDMPLRGKWLEAIFISVFVFALVCTLGMMRRILPNPQNR